MGSEMCIRDSPDDELLLRLLPLEEDLTLPDELRLEEDELDRETLLLPEEDELLFELERTELDFLLGLDDFFTVSEFDELELLDFLADWLDLFIRTIFLPVVLDSGPVR